MKKIYFLITTLFLTLGVNAQYIYSDFDVNQNVTFNGWPNNDTIVVNPDASGINTSANVTEWVRSTEQYANVYAKLSGPIDLSTNTVFHIKVYSPIACEVLFKLENQADGSKSVQVSQNITTTNQWVQLDFLFAKNASSPYDQITLFFDFATTTDNTFYFDDVEGPGLTSRASSKAVTLPVTFDNDSVDYGLTDFGGDSSVIVVDPGNASNKVAKTIRYVTAATWAGTTVGGTVGFPKPIPFAKGATSMTVAVWSPTAGTPVRLKVENSNDPTVSVETQVNTTVAKAWDTLTFDFNHEATGTATLNLASLYNKASIFFDFGTTGAQAGVQTYYWDDMEFGSGGTGVKVKPLLATNVQDNFENDGTSTITNWKFQDPALVPLTITTDPTDSTNHVANYDRSGSFQYTNAQAILDHRMDLSKRNIIQLRVYFPSTNDYSGLLTPTASVKLQNSLMGANAWQTQTEVKDTLSKFNQWVTLEFNFSGVADSANYDQIVVQLGGEGHNVPGQFYFDDFYLKQPTTGIQQQQLTTLKVFPNPAVNQIQFSHADEIQTMIIYNMVGQQVYGGTPKGNTLNVSNWDKGIYFIRIVNRKGLIATTKFVKK